MEKKKRILSGLIAALAAVTLVSCCFVGVTFARYTSTYGGSATVDVAKWSIEVDGPSSGSTDVEFGQLSPSMLEYVDSARSKSTSPTLVATITNNSDVSATVTVTAAEATNFFLDENGDPFKFTNTTSASVWYEEDELDGIFSIALFSDAAGENALTSTTLANGESLTVYAVVTWTSDDDTVTGDDADARDTWIGENISKIAYTLSYVAEQATEQPTT